jgi:hypothetical protein
MKEALGINFREIGNQEFLFPQQSKSVPGTKFPTSLLVLIDSLDLYF